MPPRGRGRAIETGRNLYVGGEQDVPGIATAFRARDARFAIVARCIVAPAASRRRSATTTRRAMGNTGTVVREQLAIKIRG